MSSELPLWSHTLLIRPLLVVVHGHPLTIVRRLLLPTTILRLVAVGLPLQVRLLLMRHKFKAFCVAHGRSILDRLAMLLVEEGHLVRVQIQDVPDLVADISTDTFVAAVF